MCRTVLLSALVALAAAAAFLTGGVALGRSEKAKDPFKGRWEITLDTPFGAIPVSVSLQPNGKGKIWLGKHEVLPVVHQEAENWISWTLELPAVQAPDGNAHTIIGRGTLGEAGDMSGNLVIVTAIPDQESPVGYETHVGTFGATKRGK